LQIKIFVLLLCMETEKTTIPDYVAELDAMYIDQKIKIDPDRKQSYRNNANFLKKVKQKLFTIKKIGNDYFAIRHL
jgi:hypothetical protein